MGGGKLPKASKELQGENKEEKGTQYFCLNGIRRLGQRWGWGRKLKNKTSNDWEIKILKEEQRRERKDNPMDLLKGQEVSLNCYKEVIKTKKQSSLSLRRSQGHGSFR